MSSILIVGVGGLGCPFLFSAAHALSARGVRVHLVDDDLVDLSNLHRQVLYRAADVGRPKVEAAREAIGRRWPALAVTTDRRRLDANNAASLVAGHTVIIDGSDNLVTKFLVNDTAVAAQIPLVHGAVSGWGGQLMTVVPSSACYRCLFEAPPAGEVATCAADGVLGPVCGVIAARMADEAILLLDGARPQLAGSLEVWELRQRSDEKRRVSIRRRADCPAHPPGHLVTKSATLGVPA